MTLPAPLASMAISRRPSGNAERRRRRVETASSMASCRRCRARGINRRKHMRSDASVTLPSSRVRRSGWRLDVPICMAGLLCLAAAVTLGACASGSPSPSAASPCRSRTSGWSPGDGRARPRAWPARARMTTGSSSPSARTARTTSGSTRTIGVFGGKGQATIADGKLQMEGERGRSTLSSTRATAARYLRGEGVLRAGGTVLDGAQAGAIGWASRWRSQRAPHRPPRRCSPC